MWLTKDGRRAGWDSSEVRDTFQDVLNTAGMGMMSLGDEGVEPQYCTPHSIRASAVAWACRLGSVTAGLAMCIIQAMQKGGGLVGITSSLAMSTVALGITPCSARDFIDVHFLTKMCTCRFEESRFF